MFYISTAYAFVDYEDRRDADVRCFCFSSEMFVNFNFAVFEVLL